MANSKRLLSVQSLQRQNILKGNGFDIHNILRKIETKLPKDALVFQNTGIVA